LAGPDRDISGKVREGTRRLAESDGKLLIFVRTNQQQKAVWRSPYCFHDKKINYLTNYPAFSRKNPFHPRAVGVKKSFHRK
jgi:hypothetical protein